MKSPEREKIDSLYSDRLSENFLKRREEAARQRSQRRIYLSALSAVALSVSASFSFIFLTDRLEVPIGDLLPMLAALASIFVAIVSIFFREREREKDNLKREIYHLDDERVRLVREWIAFESLSRQFVDREGRPNAPTSLIEIIQILSDRGVIGEIDTGILAASLKSRNQIVHTGESSLSRSEEALLQERLSEINERLFTKLAIGAD
jgi:hypothetical protein